MNFDQVKNKELSAIFAYSAAGGVLATLGFAILAVGLVKESASELNPVIVGGAYMAWGAFILKEVKAAIQKASGPGGKEPSFKPN